MSLFRNEVVEYRRNQQHHGDVLLLQSTSAKLLTWFGLASVVVAATFLAFAQYSHKQTVSGFLVPVSGTAKVFASHAGVVQDVLVRQGATVSKGQPLFTVSTEQIAADQSDVQQQILAILRQQKSLLVQQIDAEQARISSEKERLMHLLQSLQTEEQSILAQVASQETQIKLADSLVAPAVQLRSKGLLTNHEYTARVSDVLQQRQKLDSLNQQLYKLRNQMTETQYSLDQLPTTMGEKIQSLRSTQADIEQRLSQTNAQRAYIIRAPTSGRVSLLAVSPGQSADPKHVQMEIIPENGTLQAELLVPPRAIGFIEPGQTVRIRYDAFPYQEFGVHAGTVTEISQTMLTDSNGPIRLESPAYQVIASIEAPDIDVHSRRVSLQPDMTLKADVILEKRPLYRWMLEPLYGAKL